MDIITVSDRMAEIVPVTPSLIEFSDDTEVTYEQNHEEIIQELEAKHQSALSGQRKSFEEAIQRIQLENEAQNIADKSLADFYALAQSEMKEVADTKDNAEWMTRIDVLTKSLGSSNAINMVHATVAALKQLESPVQIAARRGLPLEDVAPAAIIRASQMTVGA